MSPRSRTLSRKTLAREARAERSSPEYQQIAADMRALDAQRPRCRADCIDGDRPCPFILCKHHLFLDVNPSTGSIKFNFPDRGWWELEETCALDVADQGGVTLDRVGELMAFTRERTRQIETSGLERLREVVGDE